MQKVVPFKKSKQWWICVAVIVCYWLGMFAGTHLPQPRVLEVTHNDKFLHFGASTGLAFLLCCSSSLRGRLNWHMRFIVLAIVSLYGVFDETTQPLVGRDCDIWDWVADTLGACAGILCFAVARRGEPARVAVAGETNGESVERKP